MNESEEYLLLLGLGLDLSLVCVGDKMAAVTESEMIIIRSSICFCCRVICS